MGEYFIRAREKQLGPMSRFSHFFSEIALNYRMAHFGVVCTLKSKIYCISIEYFVPVVSNQTQMWLWPWMTCSPVVNGFFREHCKTHF